MTPEHVNEIIMLTEIDEWVGEDDFGYSVAALTAEDIGPELWAKLEPAPEHTHLIVTITANGMRSVIPVTKEEADSIIRATEESYEAWLETLEV